MSSNSKKKRRVAADGGGANLTAVNCAESAHDVHNELIAMKSTMNELLDHTRAQTENMKSMMTLMGRDEKSMKRMQSKSIDLEMFRHIQEGSIFVGLYLIALYRVTYWF